MERRKYAMTLRRLVRPAPRFFKRSRLCHRATACYYLGYWPRVTAPRSFNEKILWTKFNNRDPRFVRVADKIAVRDYVREVLGSVGDDILLPILWSGPDPAAMPFEDLPDAYVVKANHGTQCNLFVRDKQKAVAEKIIDRCRHWLATRYGDLTHEWHYGQIEPQILVEPMMQDDNGAVPSDYKFFCCNGRVELVQVDFDRYSGHSRSLFDREFSSLDVRLIYPQGPAISPPPRYDEMLGIAETLAKPFDFMRVDLYNLDGAIVFGEMTVFPESGMGDFDPVDFDFVLGRRLQLTTGPRAETLAKAKAEA